MLVQQTLRLKYSSHQKQPNIVTSCKSIMPANANARQCKCGDVCIQPSTTPPSNRLDSFIVRLWMPPRFPYCHHLVIQCSQTSFEWDTLRIRNSLLSDSWNKTTSTRRNTTERADAHYEQAGRSSKQTGGPSAQADRTK